MLLPQSRCNCLISHLAENIALLHFFAPFKHSLLVKCVIVVTTILNIPLDSYLKIGHLEEEVFFQEDFPVEKDERCMLESQGELI